MAVSYLEVDQAAVGEVQLERVRVVVVVQENGREAVAHVDRLDVPPALSGSDARAIAPTSVKSGRRIRG